MAAIRETLADVEAMIPRYSWEIMDEDQRDTLLEKVVLPRYMKTTADGVDLGPAVWAQMVGATNDSIRGRVKRLKARSGPQGPRSLAPTETQKSAIRATRSTLKAHPNLAEEVLKDPAVREILTDAVLRNAGQTRKHAPVSDQRRELDLFKLMNDAGLAAERVVKHIDDYVPDADAKDEAIRLAQDLDGTVNVLRRWATGKNVGDEIEAFLAERGES